MTSPLVEGSVEAPARLFDAALLDLDGVLYVGPDAVPGAPEAVERLRAAGMQVAFVTNNASRTPETVAAHLSRLGIDAVPTDVVTSAQAAARVLAALVPARSRVLVIGGEGLEVALRDRALEPVGSLDDDPVAVAQGFSPDVGWRMLAEGTAAVRAGLPWVASNVDLTVPTPRGPAPGNGALVGVVALASGCRPIVAGKPETGLHLESVERLGACRPVVVGDRLDTDIEGANRAGVASLLVLTGVTTVLDVIDAPPARRPTWLACDLASGLLAPHPPVVVEDDVAWRCGDWVVYVLGGRVVLRGGGPPIDAARALCVAAWHTGVTSDGLDDAVRAIATTAAHGVPPGSRPVSKQPSAVGGRRLG